MPPDERLVYLSRIRAVEANRLPLVVEFRQEHLPDGLLEFEEVEVWIRSRPRPPARYSYQVTFGTILQDLKRGDSVATYRQVLEALKAMSDEELEQYAFPVPDVDEVIIRYMVPSDPWHRVHKTNPGGTVQRLKHVAEKLVKRYGWNEAQAVVFVLNGRVPLIPKARIKTPWNSYHGWRIELNVEPRLSPSEVAKVYSDVRSKLHPGRDRPMSKKHLELALFVAQHSGRTWEHLMRLWNRSHPEWAYEHVWNFSRDAGNAYERVTGEKWVHDRTDGQHKEGS